MALKVQLSEVLTPTMLETHREHIESFLLQEGIAPDLHALGATTLTERQLKELLAELADDMP